jgi:hypothetical protein
MNTTRIAEKTRRGVVEEHAGNRDGAPAIQCWQVAAALSRQSGLWNESHRRG